MKKGNMPTARIKMSTERKGVILFMLPKKNYFVWIGNKSFREVDLDFNVSVSLEETALCNQKSMSWRKGRRGN